MNLLVQVELVYRQQQLQFRPPIEEIRMKYFTQLKRFLSIPNNFRGVGESAENLIFPLIIERNAHKFGHLFKNAEELFQRLDTVKARFYENFTFRSVSICMDLNKFPFPQAQFMICYTSKGLSDSFLMFLHKKYMYLNH